MSVAYSSFHEAYHSSLCYLRDNGREVPSISDPTSVGTHFGKKDRATKELLGFQFELLSPLNRLVGCERKRINLPYAVASFLWFMTGDDTPDMICFYNERGRDFLESGRFCCAFGSRIHRSDSGNQTEQVIARLGSDPTSRRATIAVFSPRDLLESPRDTPCLFGFQFFIREGRLLCLGTMRSQSAALVMPYDIFVFTMLQEYVAVRLGQTLGSYIHICHSFHYYEDERSEVERIVRAQAPPPQAMPPMPESIAADLLELASLEQIMRNRLLDDHNASVSDLEHHLAPYARGLFSILIRGARKSVSAERRSDDPTIPEWSVSF